MTYDKSDIKTYFYSYKKGIFNGAPSKNVMVSA